MRPVLFRFAAAAAIVLGAASCVNRNDGLGYIATNQQYDIYNTEFDIEDIRAEKADGLSEYSLYRFTVGAIRDELFGLTTREAAFTLVPVFDTLDFGSSPVFRQFHFSAVNDSVSVADVSQSNILQNIYVYELNKAIDLTASEPELSYSPKLITDGIPVYNGADSLSFNFSREFGEKFLTISRTDLDTISNYTARFPGIILRCDEPAGFGGRINMFKLPINIQTESGYTSVYGSAATLKFTSTYDERGPIDTSFLFYLGPLNFYDLSDVSGTNVSTYPQIAYNRSVHGSDGLVGPCGENVYFEGGTGVKPVIKAGSLRNRLLAEVAAHGDPTKVIVNKATIELPFEFPDNYEEMYLYPTTLSPTVRIVTDTSMTFAGISDASASDENQGEINRSTLRYEPDLAHHIQEIISKEDDSDISNYDIWMLAMADEVISESSSTSSSSEYNDYLQQMMYYNYYNSMYGGYGGYGGYGYGGYGYGDYGYGGYGSYYNNYYNMMMLSQMYSSSSGSTETTQSMMDYHRFYKGILNGPSSKGERPKLKITYSLPKE